MHNVFLRLSAISVQLIERSLVRFNIGAPQNHPHDRPHRRLERTGAGAGPAPMLRAGWTADAEGKMDKAKGAARSAVVDALNGEPSSKPVGIAARVTPPLHGQCPA